MEAKLCNDDEHVSFYEDGEHKKTLKTAESHNGRPALILQEIDGFITSFSSFDSLEVLDFVDLFLESVESKISSYEQREAFFRLGHNEDEDVFFYESITRIWKIINKMDELKTVPVDAVTKLIRSRASFVLDHAMSFLDDEFRLILENDLVKMNTSDSKSHPSFKQASLSHHSNFEPEMPVPNEPGQEFAAFSPAEVCSMSRMATAMISAGYEAECCLLYAARRREAFRAELMNLRFENVAADDLQRMPWEAVEMLITLWISAVDLCSTNLFTAERDLCTSIFSEHPQIGRTLFRENASAVILLLLNFADGVVLVKRSSEKLFKLVDIYQTLNHLIPKMDDETWTELTAETSETQSRVAEAAVTIFCELEHLVKNDIGRIPVPSGAVHPLTRYVINYLKYTCEYRETLEKIFDQTQSAAGGSSSRKHVDSEQNQKINIKQEEDSDPEETVFSVQLNRVLNSLAENLEKKSRLYRDSSLRSIFLMNNWRYIVKKVEGSKEILEIMGSKWVKKRLLELHRHHKNYQRETWGRVLQNMRRTGVQQGNGKVSKTAVKERFKNFNASFDEIHKRQSTWVVSDEQLQSELRVSISALVVPAYRSFLGQFRLYLDRHSEKYIKYLPEDIELLIEGLFAGNKESISRKRV